LIIQLTNGVGVDVFLIKRLWGIHGKFVPDIVIDAARRHHDHWRAVVVSAYRVKFLNKDAK